MDKPHRRYKVTISIGADTWEDAVAELDELARHVSEHGPGYNAVSGSPSVGSHVVVEVDPEMDHAKYFQWIENWKTALGADRSK